jgi:hypothetical protein
LIDCPLVLIYQTLGNVRSVEISSALNEQMNKASAAASSAGLIAQSVKVKNTIASQANATSLAPFFQVGRPC